MKWLVVLVAVMLGFGSLIWGQSLPMRQITTEDGLPGMEVKNASQDRNGYVWMTTTAGLSRFDGREFIRYGREKGLPSSDVRLPFEDSQGRLWFYMETQAFGYIQGGQVHTSQSEQWLANMKFPNEARPHSMVEDSSGKIWACNSQQYLILEGTNVKFGQLLGPEEGRFGRLVVGKSGEILWVGFDEVLRWNGSEFKHRISRYVPAPGSMFAVAHGDTLLFLSTEGIVEWTPESERIFIPARHCPTKVVSVFKDHKGNLLIQTGEGELLQSAPNEDGIYAIPNKVELGFRIERMLLQDDEHNLWLVPEDGGVAILLQGLSNIRNLDADNVLQSNEITALTGNDKGQLYIANGLGSIEIISQLNGQPKLDSRSNFEHRKIHGLLPSSERLYAFTDSGLLSLKYLGGEGALELLGKDKSVRFPKLWDFHCNANGPFSFNTGGRIYRGSVENGFNIQAIELLQTEMVSKYCHRVGKDETLWMGTPLGLSSIRNGKETVYQDLNKNIHSKIEDIHPIHGDTIAIATAENGIYLVAKGQIINHLQLSDSLSSRRCRAMAFDGRSLWVGTDKGIAKICAVGSTLRLETIFTTADGLASNRIDHLLIVDGNLVAATEAGLSLIPLTQLPQKHRCPKVHLLERKISGITLEDGQVLDWDQNDLSVKYVGISYAQHQRVRYRYSLRKANEPIVWNETRGTEISYPELSPGQYVFKIQSSIEYETWSPAQAFGFEIRPPIWQQLWFQVCFALPFFLGVYGIFRWRLALTKRKIHARLQQEHRITSLEMQASQAMMNPHFVFNAMNSIKHFMHLHDTENAEAYLTRFAKLVRKNLDMLAKTLIPIDEEISFIGDYVAIEALRFQGKLQWSIEASDDIANADIMIPVMIVQPFVENAIWHGLLPNNDASKLRVEFILLADESLVVEISDNGAGMMHKRGDADHVGKGLSLTQERLRLLGSLSGKEIRVEYDASEPKNELRPGTLVRITFPKDFETAVISADIDENGSTHQ